MYSVEYQEVLAVALPRQRQSFRHRRCFLHQNGNVGHNGFSLDICCLQLYRLHYTIIIRRKNDQYTPYHIRDKTTECLLAKIIVNRGGIAVNPGKHQKNKQRYQDLVWKVHDHMRVQLESFVLPSYTMHELFDQHVSIGQFLCTVKAKNANKKI